MRPFDRNLEIWLDAAASDVVNVINGMTNEKIEWSGMRRAIAKEVDRQYSVNLPFNEEALEYEIAQLEKYIAKEPGAEASSDMKAERRRLGKALKRLRGEE